MTGTSDQEVDQVELKMDASLGQWVPIVDESVCGQGIQCPVLATSEWTMKYALLVDDKLPNGRTETRWRLVGNGGDDELACAYIQFEFA